MAIVDLVTVIGLVLAVALLGMHLYSLGYLILNRYFRSSLDHLSNLEAYALSTALGSVATSLGVFVILLLHLFYLWTILPLILIAPCFYLLRMRFVLQHPMNKANFVVPGLAIAIFFLIVLPITLHPPIAWDSIEYHLPIVKMLVDTHYLAYNQYLREDFLPQGAELIYAVLYLYTRSGIAVQVFNAYLFIVLMLAVSTTAKRLLGKTGEVIALSLMAGLPLALLMASIAYTDMYLALICFVALMASLIWLQEDRKSSLVIAALLFGGSISIKETAGIYWAATILVSLVSIKDLLRKGGYRKTFIAHVTIVLAVAAPWFIRNWIITGNPVYPFATSILGNTGPWTASEIMGQLQNYTLGHVGGILTSPNVIGQIITNVYPTEGLPSPLSLALFVGIGASIFSSTIWKPSTFRMILATSLYVLVISYDTIDLRYLYSAIPALVIVSTVGYVLLIKLLIRFIKWIASILDDHLEYPRVPHYMATILLCVLCIAPGIQYSQSIVNGEGIVLGKANSDAFLTAQLPAYSAFQYLNERFGHSYSVYAIHQENMRYYCDGIMIGDWFGPDSFSRFINASGSLQITKTNVAQLKSELLSQRIDYLLTPTTYLSIDPQQLGNYFTTIFNKGGFLILKPHSDV